ncbi:MAG TPA: SDR family NAD(P)-dependent oxidoreductase [Clostridia bacterium]|nr:SDR family NAD(P)-dependent oxidoreductase [Clostridia bacterium]
MNRFEGKVCAVTGAARGIGAAISARLVSEGARHVALIDVNEGDARAAASALGERTAGYGLDVSKGEDAARVLGTIEAEFGTIDVLINNAGTTRDAMFHKMSFEQWSSVLDVNLTGVYNCCKAVVPGMRTRAAGRIVNLTSVSSFGNIGQANYGAAKAGVIGLTKCLARELARYSVTVNCIAPSYVDTDMLRAVPEEVMNRFLSARPAGKAGGDRRSHSLPGLRRRQLHHRRMLDRVGWLVHVSPNGMARSYTSILLG